jgi:hypothetical protein
LIDGFAVNPANQEVSMEAHKYLNNFRNAFCFSCLFIGVVMVLSGIFINVFQKAKTEFGFQELVQFLPFGCCF